MFLIISLSESVGKKPPDEIIVMLKFMLSKSLMPENKKTRKINADKEMIKLAANELQSAVDKMRKKKYNPNIPAKVKKNIRYHYFSVGRD